MAITEEEKKIARAYNVGAVLALYEPRLLENIIRNNKDNDFVKTMEVAKDNHEFSVGIPRKDYNRNYKNGYNNAKALAMANDPTLLDKMIASKDLDVDFRKGLEAGKKEIKIRQTMQRMKHERDDRQRDINRDLGIEY